MTLRTLNDLGRRSLTRFAEIGGVDRAMGLAAQAFTAVFPLLIVFSALLHGGSGESVGDMLVKKLDLTGDAADAVHRAFPDSSSVEQSVTWLSGALVLISVLSFTRALQRLYERAWQLDAHGIRDTGWGMLWLVSVGVYVGLHPVLRDVLPEWARIPASVAGSVLVWIATPYLVLARRLEWRVLMPQAVLTAAGMAVFLAGSEVYMPRAAASASEQYGTIGFAFALVSWLFAAGIVIAGTAVLGACIRETPGAWGRPRLGRTAR